MIIDTEGCHGNVGFPDCWAPFIQALTMEAVFKFKRFKGFHLTLCQGLAAGL